MADFAGLGSFATIFGQERDLPMSEDEFVLKG